MFVRFLGNVRKKPREDKEKTSKTGSGVITKAGLSQALSQTKSQISKASDIPSWCRIKKRDKFQLKFDMKVLKYLIRGQLPFKHVVKDGAFSEFCKTTELQKYHLKAPTTYSKAKLPLLYHQVQDAVTAQIKKDIPGTLRFLFTADLWSSR